MEEEKKEQGFELYEVAPIDAVRGTAKRPEPQPAVEPDPKPVPAVQPSEETADTKAEPRAEPKTDPVVELTEPTVDYKSEYENAQARLKELETKSSPYKNPNYYKLEVIEEESPKELPLYQKLVLGNPDAKELWRMGFLQKHPEFADRPDVVQRRLERAYPALFSPDVTPEEQEYKDAQVDLEIDASDIKKKMMERLEGIKIPDPKATQEDTQKKTADFVNSWKPHFSQLPKETKFTIEVPDEKDPSQKEAFEFEIPQSEQKRYFEQAAYFVLQQQLPVSEKSFAQVKEFVRKQYIADHHGEIAASIAREVAKKKDEAWSKKVNNPTPIKSPDTPIETVARATKEDKVNEFLSKY